METEIKIRGRMCANCEHEKWLHYDGDDNLVGVFCSAYAEAPVADCDCPGFKEQE